jgi:hypothetical protein
MTNILRKSTLEDVDEAIFSWFDRDLNCMVKDAKERNQKVTVLLSGMERWYALKMKKKVRDSSNTLILPIIAIRRTDFEKVQDAWALGRFFKTIAYTKVLNGYETAIRANAKDARTRNNYCPTNDLNEKVPVYELIEIPYPTLVKVNYEIKVYTQYIIDMNAILEKMWAKTNDSAAGMNQIQIKSRNDNKYILFLDQTATNASNIEDYSDKQRTLITTLQFKVLAYLLNETDASIRKTIPCVSSISLSEKVITSKEEIAKIFKK